MTTLRVIKRPDPQPIEMKELGPEDSAFYLARDFGMTDFADTQPSEPLEWVLEEIKPSRIDRNKRSLRK
jgi:hypothetical protein